MTEDELLESVVKANSLFKKLIEKVGSEYFTTDKDGVVSFNWSKKKEKLEVLISRIINEVNILDLLGSYEKYRKCRNQQFNNRYL